MSVVLPLKQSLWSKAWINLLRGSFWSTHFHGHEIRIQTSHVGMDFIYSQHSKHYAINLHYSSKTDGQLSLPSICRGKIEARRWADLCQDSQETGGRIIIMLISMAWLPTSRSVNHTSLPLRNLWAFSGKNLQNFAFWPPSESHLLTTDRLDRLCTCSQFSLYPWDFPDFSGKKPCQKWERANLSSLTPQIKKLFHFLTLLLGFPQMCLLSTAQQFCRVT